jgi:hypothetical protein
VRPAYQIPLNQDELAHLGTLIAIFGQIDDLMVQLVAHLLKLDRPAANVVMGSTNVEHNVEIWCETICNRTKDEDVLWLIEQVRKEFPDVTRKRNDFIHAVFFHRTAQIAGGPMITGGGGSVGGIFVSRPSPLARRYKSNSPSRSVDELPALIEQCSRLSCMVAHVDHLMAGNPATSSPWLERLAPTLPPRLDTAEERKAKARHRQPKPSRKKP